MLLLLQQMCVYLVIAYLLSKTPLFIPLMQVTIRLPHKLLCYVIFSVFCIMGTYFGLHIQDSIANTRAIGAVWQAAGRAVGGLSGRADRRPAPVYARRHDRRGLRDLHGVGRHGRRHRTQHRHAPGAHRAAVQSAVRRRRGAGGGSAADGDHHGSGAPYDEALQLVEHIALPMMIANTVGAAMFMQILLDRRAMFEKYTSAFSSRR